MGKVRQLFHSFIEQGVDRIGAASPITAEKRATIEECANTLASLIGEEVDAFPGLTGPELRSCLERAGISVPEAAIKCDLNERYFPANVGHAGELSLQFKNTLRPLREAIDRVRVQNETRGKDAVIGPSELS
jgi:hypothetical protein